MGVSFFKLLLFSFILTLFPQLSMAENADNSVLNFENCLFKNPSCRSEWLSPTQKQSLRAEQTRQNFYYCSHNLPQCKRQASVQALTQQRYLQAQRIANQRRYQVQQARVLAAKTYRAPIVYKLPPKPIQRRVINRQAAAPIPVSRPQPVEQRAIVQVSTRRSSPVLHSPRPSVEYIEPSKLTDNQSGQVSSAVEYVRGYTRKNGTKVKGYYRTKRDKTLTNNFSYYKNVNPYTGRRGHVYPDNFTSSRVSYVRGYYRNDGTYVKGHYRRR